MLPEPCAKLPSMLCVPKSYSSSDDDDLLIVSTTVSVAFLSADFLAVTSREAFEWCAPAACCVADRMNKGHLDCMQVP